MSWPEQLYTAAAADAWGNGVSRNVSGLTADYPSGVLDHPERHGLLFGLNEVAGTAS